MKIRNLVACCAVALCAVAASGAERTLKPASYVKTVGETDCLVLRIAFSDRGFNYTNSTWDIWFNKENGSSYRNICPGGSVRDYYITQSNGKFKPHFDVYDVTLGYAFDPEGYEYLVSDALQVLANQYPSIDLSKYDLDGDKVVDNITVLYTVDAGYDFTPCQSAFNWYPSVYVPTINGYTFNAMNYICEKDYGQMLGIGTFIHEYGHVMGFPDSYYQTEDGSFRMNQWDIMNQGIYNVAQSGDITGSTPPNMNAYQTWALGWTTPTEIKGLGNYQLNVWNSAVGGKQAFESYVITNAQNPNDFYVLEYRSNATGSDGKPLSKYDYPLFNSGMLIWHIIYEAGKFHNTTAGEHVKLVCADGNAYDGQRDSDPWPGTLFNTRFSPTTTPAFRWGLNEAGNSVDIGSTAIMLNDIMEYGNVLKFRVCDLQGNSVGNIAADQPAGPVEYINLQGQPVANPTHGQLLIRRQGGQAEKVVVE